MQKQKNNHQEFAGDSLVANIGRMHSKLTVIQVIGHIMIWLLITFFTFGIGGLFWPYAAIKLITESIVIADETGHATARLRCKFSFGDQLGHAVLWAILIVLTGGLALPGYLFGVAHTAINRTELISA